jgi:hypothetical protein
MCNTLGMKVWRARVVKREDQGLWEMSWQCIIRVNRDRGWTFLFPVVIHCSRYVVLGADKAHWRQPSGNHTSVVQSLHVWPHVRIMGVSALGPLQRGALLQIQYQPVSGVPVQVVAM